MMFCPECKGMLVPVGGKLKCRKCGYIEEATADKSVLKRTEKRDEKEIVIIEDAEQMATLPTIAVRCPECGHDIAEWWLRQLRSADESEVRFFRCVKCRHTWREYD
ncbi:DNA-directed RNA polymerase subunit M [Methanomicrobiaceae archaeon CYW5]|uniref:transcription factor S n=1 Tax=Methanovulcanius yangii TaxID=1789227 RepID=UPI0029CA3A82|nr:transcription factor S [Methanovulcanius yangii]MBT8507462.1 DNA-directed RNA polymerase subunit M [Methanovulcanius yangii]